MLIFNVTHVTLCIVDKYLKQNKYICFIIIAIVVVVFDVIICLLVIVLRSWIFFFISFFCPSNKITVLGTDEDKVKEKRFALIRSL